MRHPGPSVNGDRVEVVHPTADRAADGLTRSIGPGERVDVVESAFLGDRIPDGRDAALGHGARGAHGGHRLRLRLLIGRADSCDRQHPVVAVRGHAEVDLLRWHEFGDRCDQRANPLDRRNGSGLATGEGVVVGHHPDAIDHRAHRHVVVHPVPAGVGLPAVVHRRHADDELLVERVEASRELGEERDPVGTRGRPGVATVGEGERLVVEVDTVEGVVGHHVDHRLHMGCARGGVGQHRGHRARR